jgi:hypothetical protein
VGTLPNRITPVLVVALAALVGFSPTADSLTRGVSGAVIVLRTPVAACPRVARDACGEAGEAGCRGSDESSPVRHACRAEDPTPVSRCAGEPGTRPCCQCFFVGGLLLFTVAKPPLDPDLRLLGRIAPRDLPPVLRFLIPPVPPPIGGPDTRA